MFRFPIKAASAYITNSKSEILLLKRSSSVKSYKGFWQFPEGKIHFKESAKQALKRELEEEIDYKPKNIKYLGDYSYIQKLFFIPLFRITRVVYKVGVPTQIKLSHEHSAYKWINFKKINHYKLLPGLEDIINKLGI